MIIYVFKHKEKNDNRRHSVYNMSYSLSYSHFIVNGNIYRIIANGLKNDISSVSMENLNFKYYQKGYDNLKCPDIMIICDKKLIKRRIYSRVPRFIAETLDNLTTKQDRTEKKDICEKAGVEEYWIISPQGSVEIYYLQDGKYVLEQCYMLQEDKEEDYNVDVEISLKAFPHIKMTLGEIFEGVFE